MGLIQLMSCIKDNGAFKLCLLIKVSKVFKSKVFSLISSTAG